MGKGKMIRSVLGAEIMREKVDKEMIKKSRGEESMRKRRRAREE